MEIDEIVRIHNSSRFNDKVKKENIISALNEFSVLGTGCEIIGGKYIKISPFALSNDCISLIELINKRGKTSVLDIKELNWQKERYYIVVVC